MFTRLERLILGAALLVALSMPVACLYATGAKPNIEECQCHSQVCSCGEFCACAPNE